MTPSPPPWRTPLIVLVCATAILFLSLGCRQTFGLLLSPVSADLGWGREVLSFAIAIQSVFWGLTTPISGAIADRYGPGRVVAFGGIAYAAGLLLMSQASSPFDAMAGLGFLTGIAMSATMFPIVLTIVGRIAPENKRGLYLGIASAGGSSGQVVLIPGAQWMIGSWGWSETLIVLALIAALITPMAAAVAGANERGLPGRTQSIGAALREASGHSGFILVTAGYFVCGFQTMFIGAHLPALLGDRGVSPLMGATALSVIGLFNIFGCFAWGALSGKFKPKYLLCWLYVLRSLFMALFFIFPMTEFNVILFSIILGLLWLGTVPLTSSVVAQIFGTQYLSTLFGISFVSHQIGSFLGIWLAGRLYDETGSYGIIWWSAVAMGVVAAFLNYPIDDRPVARIAAASRA